MKDQSSSNEESTASSSENNEYLNIVEVDSKKGTWSCRVCFEDCSAIDKAISPCKCKGTQKYIHIKCLRRWQQKVQSRNPHDERAKICNVCQTPYSLPPPCPSPFIFHLLLHPTLTIITPPPDYDTNGIIITTENTPHSIITTTCVLQTLKAVAAVACIMLVIFGLMAPPLPHIALMFMLLLGTRSQSMFIAGLLTILSILATLHLRSTSTGLYSSTNIGRQYRHYERHHHPSYQCRHHHHQSSGGSISPPSDPVSHLIQPGLLLASSSPPPPPTSKGWAVEDNNNNNNNKEGNTMEPYPPPPPSSCGSLQESVVLVYEVQLPSSSIADDDNGNNNNGNNGEGVIKGVLLTRPITKDNNNTKKSSDDDDELVVLHTAPGQWSDGNNSSNNSVVVAGAKPLHWYYNRDITGTTGTSSSNQGEMMLYHGGSLPDVFTKADNIWLFQGTCTWTTSQLVEEMHGGRWMFTVAQMDDLMKSRVRRGDGGTNTEVPSSGISSSNQGLWKQLMESGRLEEASF